jgi:hypothetical protein
MVCSAVTDAARAPSAKMREDKGDMMKGSGKKMEGRERCSEKVEMRSFKPFQAPYIPSR